MCCHMRASATAAQRAAGCALVSTGLSPSPRRSTRSTRSLLRPLLLPARVRPVKHRILARFQRVSGCTTVSTQSGRRQ